jgi:hypothetical protein
LELSAAHPPFGSRYIEEISIAILFHSFLIGQKFNKSKWPNPQAVGLISRGRAYGTRSNIFLEKALLGSVVSLAVNLGKKQSFVQKLKTPRGRRASVETEPDHAHEILASRADAEAATFLERDQIGFL